MTDRLKLSDLKGDRSADETARKLIVDDLNARIEALERGNAELERRLKQQKAASTSGSAKLGVRKDGSFKAVSTAPSINKTPRGPAMVPAAYPTVQDLSNSVGTAKSVRFNGKPVYLLDSSTQPSCKGDDAGTGGGIRSGTVNGEVKPTVGAGACGWRGRVWCGRGIPAP